MDLNEALVNHADILIFGLIFASALATLPRAYARFSRGSEWSQGLRLYSVVPRRSINPLGNLNPPISYPMDAIKSSVVDFDTDPSLTACNTLPYRSGTTPFRDPYNEKDLPMTPPRSTPYLFRPLASMLRYRVHDNYSVGQVFLMMVYITIIFYVSFYKSNPFTDPQRAGWVITSQVPFVYALATKNNIIGMMVGVGYEKVRLINRRSHPPH